MNNILFFGDSNTWGFNPETGLRYPYEQRWTTICAKLLGEDYNCIPSGMNGRASVFDDPLKGCRNALTGLDYVLQTQKPLDLLVIMLGTNDLKYTDAEGSAKGMELLLADALTANERYHLSSPVFSDGARILLVSPVLVTNRAWFGNAVNAAEESKKFSGLYRGIAERLNQLSIENLLSGGSKAVWKRENGSENPVSGKIKRNGGPITFFDAADVTRPSTTDGVHLSAEGHAALGRALAEVIHNLL